VQLVPGRGVLYALLVVGGAVAEREAEGVVVDQGEGQGEGVRSERVAGLEQPGDAGMVIQDRP
jgi:hypothetical protein